MSRRVHRFDESIRKSQARAADKEYWDPVYPELFPGCVAAVDMPDGGAQRRGVDKALPLDNGKVILVQEKVREGNWDDFWLETYSVYKGVGHPGNKPGWIEQDLQCDYINYVFLPSGRHFPLPWLLLRRAWRNHGEDWKRKFPIKRAQNVGYESIGVVVPIATVQEAIYEPLLLPTQSLPLDRPRIDAGGWQAAS